MKIKIEENTNNIVKKHNDLIQKARYSLSESSIKLVSLLIAMIRVEDEDFKEYSIPVAEFTHLKESKSKNDYELVHKIIKELLSTPIQIEDAQMNFCYYAKYIKGSATAKFKIAPELKPYLLELKSNFTQYNIKNILLLKSNYVIRFYELLVSKWVEYKAYNPKSQYFTFEIDLNELRELFEIPNSYQYSSHLKKNIIEKAKKQFEQKTDISFSYKEKKLGRKVVALEITIFTNKKGSNDIFASKKDFIAYIRQTYKPNPDKEIFPTIITNEKGRLKVDLKGKIYLITKVGRIKDFNNKESLKVWDWLYESAKKDDKFLNKVK